MDVMGRSDFDLAQWLGTAQTSGTLCIPMEGPIWRVDGLETANPPVDPTSTDLKLSSRTNPQRGPDRGRKKVVRAHFFWGEHVRICEAIPQHENHFSFCFFRRVGVHTSDFSQQRKPSQGWSKSCWLANNEDGRRDSCTSLTNPK